MNFFILSSVSVTSRRDLAPMIEKMKENSPERQQKYARSREFSHFAPQKTRRFMSNKNSTKYKLARSRRDVPKSEERIEQFVDSDENQPLENRNFFFENHSNNSNKIFEHLEKPTLFWSLVGGQFLTSPISENDTF